MSIRAPSSRIRIERYRGETEGHSTHPDYLRVREFKEKHPNWGAPRIALTLGISVDHANLHIARWIGALTYQAKQPAMPSAPSEPETHPGGAELQVSGGSDNQALSYRGSRIRTIEDLLAFSQTAIIRGGGYKIEKVHFPPAGAGRARKPRLGAGNYRRGSRIKEGGPGRTR